MTKISTFIWLTDPERLRSENKDPERCALKGEAFYENDLYIFLPPGGGGDAATAGFGG